MYQSITVIGIDCSTQPQNTGLSLGVYENNQLTLKKTRLGSHNPPITETIYDWIKGQEKALAAIDTSLGWPAEMGQALLSHEAGQVINVEPDILFSRETDRFINIITDLNPFSVGADKMALH
ncbi:MAG: hypothetical protein BWY74_01694 [Firmicutes bacterium ADurb.Bin419]|nr:MAG: hypothetical protein BWY74_01694 [Firmicutes bacterium ADurb.Bin419]